MENVKCKMGNPRLGVASTLRGIANYGILTAILLWIALVAQAAGNPETNDFPLDKEWFLLGVGIKYDYYGVDSAFVAGRDSFMAQFSDERRTTDSDTISPEQKLSFLAGVFFRHGDVTPLSGYCFSDVGFAGEPDWSLDFLLDLDCKEVREDVYPFPPYLPGGRSIYFTPSEKMLEVIKLVEPYRKDLMMWEDYQMLHARDFFYGGMRKEKSGDREMANADYMEAIQLCDKYLRNHPNDYQVLRMSAMLTLLTEGMDAGIKAHEKLLEKPLEEGGLQDIRAFIQHFKNKNREAVLKSIIYE